MILNDYSFKVKLFLLVIALLVSGILAFSSITSAEMSISVDPANVDFDEVFRGTLVNIKQSDDVVVSVVSENYDYYLSVSGTDLIGQSAPAVVIPVNNMKYELDQSGTWETVSDILTAVAYGVPTGPGGEDYIFDFTLDIPGDVYLQEYQGTLTFDVSTLSVTFDPNGNSTYAQSHSSIVNVYPPSGMDSLQYQWSTSDVEGGLVEANWEVFISGQESLDVSALTGSYYIRIHARNHTPQARDSIVHSYRVWFE